MVYLNIGSNLGQAQQNLNKALEAIENHFGVPLSVSRPYYSLPWGYRSGNPFTNIGVAFDICVEDNVEAMESLLQRLLTLQHLICPKSHRNASGGYIDRVIDIDLIAIDNRVVETPTLILPHPRMHLREFALVPMEELAPDWIHPVFQLTCSQMLDNLYKHTQNVKNTENSDITNTTENTNNTENTDRTDRVDTIDSIEESEPTEESRKSDENKTRGEVLR